jgi:hypothetical protein
VWYDAGMPKEADSGEYLSSWILDTTTMAAACASPEWYTTRAQKNLEEVFQWLMQG